MAVIDDKTTDALDKIFNAWLAFHNILSQDGRLYKSDSKGQIMRNAQGGSITINAQEFKLLMLDPEKGLQAYAAKQGIRLKPQLRDFPQE
ncbi:hypothetical protein [Legionella sp. km772]|uniref:hypothetical protein n=1 Tax=Legionella sp. km772 TaxID=2498111 RepID=UPI000F8EB7D5|nr:hypothetical protein [Legionella sp. km772]RUR12449.1 hypothetical protein ELY15_05015 [Legionella sp. km772]